MGANGGGPPAAGGSGSAVGGEGSTSSQGQPHGTEYTLQGVMRFLQIEWHRHERERNGWEIERAEMKGRIAKIEGENRSSKKMQDSYSTHVRLLETALRKERDKVKAMAATNGGGAEPAALPSHHPPATADEKPAAKKREQGAPSMWDGRRLMPALASTEPHNSFLDVASETAGSLKDDALRHRSRVYLDKGLQELTYFLTSPAHPPAPSNEALLANPDQLAGHGFGRPAHAQQVPGDMYLPPRHKNPHHPDLGMSPHALLPDHQPPLVPSSDRSAPLNLAGGGQQPLPMTRQTREQRSYLANVMERERLPPSLSFPAVSDEAVDKIEHGYDGFGRSLLSHRPEGAMAPSLARDRAAVDPDAWNFDESEPPPLTEEVPIKPPLPDREPSGMRGNVPIEAPTLMARTALSSHRRKGSTSRRRSDEAQGWKDGVSSPSAASHLRADTTNFKVRFALRGHLDVVRAVVFTGGGSPSEPEICTTGDDGVLKRWIIPATYGSFGGGGGGGAGNGHGGSHHVDLDVASYFTHRGHTGAVTCLAACPPSPNFSTGGRAHGDGWVFSGGQDATIRVWERGRVDAKARLDGHTDAVWSVCLLPGTSAGVFGREESQHVGGPDRILLASGAADGTVKIWAVSAPPQVAGQAAHAGSRRGVGGSRRHSVTSGSGFPSSPQPSVATATAFHHTLVHSIARPGAGVRAAPTCLAPLSGAGDTFVVSYNDAAVLIYDTRSGEEVVAMASQETSDGTPATGVNTVVATTSLTHDDSGNRDGGSGGGAGGGAGGGHALPDDDSGAFVHGPTGSSAVGGVDGVIISGHEDRYIRFFDANSGQCTYTMLAHPAPISCVSLSPDGRELVSAGHDASLRFWSLQKRSCSQEITSHRLMRAEGVACVVWSHDGRWVVSGGGDGVVKVFCR
ncbi:MAG: hypothetical protein M1826_006309 [Phylliscum demangeonii]|nr:MAG: hypothetical protein M1826_006309 [Phylliscum demangeonii]